MILRRKIYLILGGMITDMGDPLQQSIQNRIHNLLVRVYYEDTDFSGVVYHANYLKFISLGTLT